MIDELLKRRPIKEFLKKYSTKIWSEVMTDLFEIGVLNLKNSFNKLHFTKEEFKSILYDLRDIDKKNTQVPSSTSNSNRKDNQNHNQHHQQQQITGNHQCNNKSHSDQMLPLQKHQAPYSNSNKESQSYQEDSKYISETEESNENTMSQSQRNQMIKRKLLEKPKPSTFKAEVYIPNEEEIKRRSRSNSKNRPRKQYYITQDEIKERNKENTRNLNYAESKIRSQIINDKMIHQALKRNQIPQSNPSSYQPKNSNTNYCINYDKDLKPESIHKKEKDTPIYYYSNANMGRNDEVLQNEGNEGTGSYSNNFDSESEHINQLNYNSNAYNENASDIISTNTNNAIYSNTNNQQFSDQISNSSEQQEMQGMNNVNRAESNKRLNSNLVFQSINNNKSSIPIINSLNTVETANFNQDHQRNDNAQLYYQGEDENDYGDDNDNNKEEGEYNDNDSGKKDDISFKNNTEEEKRNLYRNSNSNTNNLMQSGVKSDGELSLCNLSQRTKSKCHIVLLMKCCLEGKWIIGGTMWINTIPMRI